ncbi:hypothetical protein WM26_31045 [Burkholderia cepacia]|uniref:hypothetical protein n=1 Tax=Burkholderia cepacia TaxID=292 RepID=UPI0007600C13|nr:hypothetical protein [Burkholderia cepacia]KWO06044.1 hypothetical protein WM26_31045 [Burkholderia cepacia]
MSKTRTDDIGELKIDLDPKFGWATYTGTRMQLEFEGVIPADHSWPDGFQRYDWEVDRLHFTLTRARPPGFKGPRRNFFDCDYWTLRMFQTGQSYGAWQIQRHVAEVERLKHLHSDAGRREVDVLFARLANARADDRFQAFKTLVPGLIQPPVTRRGRPPRNEVEHD